MRASAADDLDVGRLADEEGLASDRDRTGVPVHRGWAPLGDYLKERARLLAEFDSLYLESVARSRR